MNDNTKVLDQNPSTPQVPIQPVSGGANKEIGRVSEFVRPSGAETVLNIPPEVSEVNVAEVKSDSLNLTDEHKGLMEHSGAAVPAKTAPTRTIQLQMSEEEIEKELKRGNKEDSGTWYAALLDLVIKKLPFSNN